VADTASDFEKGKRTASDWRAQARATAMQCLTQLDVQGDGFLRDLADFVAEIAENSKVQGLAIELAHLAWTHRQASDQLIAQTVKHWQLQRIALVDRAVLRLAVAELAHRPDVPLKVAIDQAIELAKEYSTAESPQFINGVLDAIVKALPGRSVPAAGSAPGTVPPPTGGAPEGSI